MPSTRFLAALPALALLLAAVPAELAAQTTPPAPAPPPPTPAAPTIDFSGVIFGSYSFQPSTTPNPQPNQVDNAFLLDRVYLTFRMPAGDRTSVRVTTEVFQDAGANAYSVRAKFAYLQYAGPRAESGASVTGRIGILQTVLYEHEELFWPRYFSQVAVEKAGYFPPADVGLASLVTLPNRMGEVYATVTNGPGYTSRERDRFKDYALRLSLTPLAGDASRPALLQSVTVTAWGYKGAVASQFVNGGTLQVGAVGDALDRSRAGVFVGVRDPRLVLGAEYARRHDDAEFGANTVVSPRSTGSTTGQLLSAFTVVRPLAFTSEDGRSPYGLVARYDAVKPTSSSDGFATPPSSENAYHNVIAGVFWDLSQRAQLALDYQESLAANNDVSSAPPVQMKGWFLHFNVTF